MDWIAPFGDTGLKVSRLGLGASEMGSPEMDDAEAGRLLNMLLDEGLTLLDTARSYDLSEERIGKYVSHRRSEYVLSTKIGYMIDGYENYTVPIILPAIERALKALKTDVLDVVHLHSPRMRQLMDSGVAEALSKARETGKIRCAAYSGDNEELAWAVDCGFFQSVQTSVNFLDQASLRESIPKAAAKGMGVIAKRPVANAPWRYKERPRGAYPESYWVRMKQLALDPKGYDWQELALRFAVYSPGVCSAIVGTTNREHVRQNVEIARKGPLPEDVQRMLRDAYAEANGGWMGLE